MVGACIDGIVFFLAAVGIIAEIVPVGYYASFMFEAGQSCTFADYSSVTYIVFLGIGAVTMVLDALVIVNLLCARKDDLPERKYEVIITHESSKLEEPLKTKKYFDDEVTAPAPRKFETPRRTTPPVTPQRRMIQDELPRYEVE